MLLIPCFYRVIMSLSLSQGTVLVKLARNTVKHFFKEGELLAEQANCKALLEKRGVFVTLRAWPEKELRGCIGYPFPIEPLWDAVKLACLSAAFEDSRFLPLAEEELSKIIFEVSVLSLPEEIKGSKEELPEKIIAGKDGLIIRKGYSSGLLLPSVAAEFRLDARQFLEACCEKAFLEK
ncbi:AmmeMemoRadiSam system protein A, partial [archaeon]|nr:AmmeMemoRadiSam system protein A [archaeon]